MGEEEKVKEREGEGYEKVKWKGRRVKDREIENEEK